MHGGSSVEEPTTVLAADAWWLLVDVVEDLDEEALLTPTRCRGWCVADVLFHLLVDAQSLLAALASPAEVDGVDTDLVSYWAQQASGVPSFDHAQFVRRGALAYARPSGLQRHWRDIALGAMRAVERADEQSLVHTTEGYVMSVHDLAAATVVELTVHYLDLVPALGHPSPAPADAALRVVRDTLDGLLGQPVNADWSDTTYALKGAGRVALTASDREALGEQAAAFPLLG